MTINERPGVYSSIEVTSSLTGASYGKVVGVAAVSSTGVKMACKSIRSYGEAVTLFGMDCELSELIRILFLNGAFAVEAVPVAVNAVSTLADYKAAFAVLMAKENVCIMICDSDDDLVHAAMREAILGASESGKYRIGVLEAYGTVAGLKGRAEALNCERLVMLFCASDGPVTEAFGEAAAALAGAIACGYDPALPLNGAELFGFQHCTRTFSDSDITALVQGGVTPIERMGEAVYVVRGITTRISTAGETDLTWRELTTVLIIDDVIPSVRSALRVKFPRVKNTVQSRGAIRTQVIIELEDKLKKEIIENYGDVKAVADESDPTVCVVSFAFAVVHGLNRINLTAHISV